MKKDYITNCLLNKIFIKKIQFIETDISIKFLSTFRPLFDH